MEADPDDQAPGLATLCVDRLLARHGIAVRQRQHFVSATLGLTYQQARRRMVLSTFTLEDLTALGAKFGESLLSVVGTTRSEIAESATMAIGTLRLPCSAVVGDKPGFGRPGPLVALRPAEGELLLLPAAEVAGVASYEVKSVQIQAEKARRYRVALLDKDRDLVTSMADYMVALGVDAEPFVSAPSIAAAIEQQPFDGYVLEWSSKSAHEGPLIDNIRAADPECPIVLLTGDIEQGTAIEAELLAMATRYRLSYFEKPIRTSSIMSALQLGLARRAGA